MVSSWVELKQQSAERWRCLWSYNIKRQSDGELSWLAWPKHDQTSGYGVLPLLSGWINNCLVTPLKSDWYIWCFGWQCRTSQGFMGLILDGNTCRPAWIELILRAGRCISLLCMLVFHAHGNPLRGGTCCTEPILFVSILQQVETHESKRVTTRCRFDYTSWISGCCYGCCKEVWVWSPGSLAVYGCLIFVFIFPVEGQCKIMKNHISKCHGTPDTPIPSNVLFSLRGAMLQRPTGNR